jgi:solute carrier family 13 (sodium-dependent dicarboxylate transporter), member 2/3/5
MPLPSDGTLSMPQTAAVSAAGVPTPDPGAHSTRPFSRTQWLGLLLGPALFAALLLAPPPPELGAPGWRTAAVALLMATWWITEVIPIPVTALLPLILFPVLGIETMTGTAVPYANPMIFLFMGGFIIAIAMQRWNLHRRVALNIIHVIGSNPGRLIAGFTVSTAFLSMWVSNTAATMMMLPIGLSVIQLARQRGADPAAEHEVHGFAVVLMLVIAYASSIGGLATVIGTPTNALLIGFVHETYGVEITFAQWMLIGVPVVALGLPLMVLTLTRLVYPLRLKTLPGGHAFVTAELAGLGPISRPELMVGGVFTLVAVLWMGRPVFEGWLPGMSDAGIAMLGAVLLFLLPIDLKKGRFLLDWASAERLPWGVLILFGGGLTLAGAIQRTGLAEWIGGFLGAISGWPILFVLVLVTLVILLLTELTSNSATAAAFLPVMGALAMGIGQDPLLLAVPVAVAASCAFMLPVATPPNAIVYGSGEISIPEMARAGLALNLVFTVLIALLTYLLVPLVLGFEIRAGS